MSVEASTSPAVIERVVADDVSVVNPAQAAEAVPAERLVETDLLVEDVSIDGMCGVY